MTDRPPNTPGGFSGLVSQILSFIDRPWKAVVVVVLILILGTGYIFWEKRNEIIGYLVTTQQFEDKLKPNLDPNLEMMIRGTKADIASVWTIDLGANNVTYVDGVNKGDGPWRPVDLDMPDDIPAIGDSTNSQVIVATLQGKPSCGGTDVGYGIFVTHVRKAGYKRFCLVPVHTYRQSPVAVIILLWKDSLDPKTEDSIVALAENEAYDMLDLPRRHR